MCAHLLEDHWELESRFKPHTKPVAAKSPPKAKQAYTLKVENKPAGKVIEILAKQIGYDVKFAADSEESAKKLVSFEVTDASAFELLSAAAAPANLRVEIVAQTVHVSPN